MSSITPLVCGLLLVLSCFVTFGEQAAVLQRRELSIDDSGARVAFEWAEHEYLGNNRNARSPRISPRAKRAASSESCYDTHDSCQVWASIGQCEANRGYMAKRCKKSCQICTVPGSDCRDMDEGCKWWSISGECEANPNYMFETCAPSCGICTRVACEDADDDCTARAAQGDCDSNADYMHTHCRRSCHVCTPDTTEAMLGPGRPGMPTRNHSCNHIRGLPEELRDPAVMHPAGLDQFYQRYTEAYGIPIIGSAGITDDALKRVCYVVRFLLAGHSGVRKYFYKRSGRLAVIGFHQQTTTIPEHSHLDSVYWDERARGLGGTTDSPIATAGEENILCFSNDTRYMNYDIFLHECSHAVHILGANFAMPMFGRRLSHRYMEIIKSGLWGTSYSTSTFQEYWGVSVQAYFNTYRSITDGIPRCMAGNWGGPIVTRERLRAFDPVLYGYVREIFPCENTYINRCEQDREAELNQQLRMDCENNPDADTYVGNPTEPQYTPAQVDIFCSECADYHDRCAEWAGWGECSANPSYMLVHCKVSCLVCTP